MAGTIKYIVMNLPFLNSHLTSFEVWSGLKGTIIGSDTNNGIVFSGISICMTCTFVLVDSDAC